MNDPKPTSIAQKIESFPLMPKTVSRVIQVINNPESSANDLVKAILPDQTMCITILKISNSALYGRSKQISSLENAVAFLGFNEIQNIVFAKATVQTFKQIPKEHKKEIDDLWAHAFTCGLAARIIAEHINQQSGEFFIAGLLHDIGKLAMLLILGKKYTTSKWFSGWSTPSKLEEEKEEFSITHDEVGARLLKHWQLPESLISAVNFHHTPQKISGLTIYPLVIQLADLLSILYSQEVKADGKSISTAIKKYLPLFEKQWCQLNLPYENIAIESWYSWLKIDMEHGSEILDILTI